MKKEDNLEHTGPGVLEWIGALTESPLGAIHFTTGKEGAILQHLAIEEAFNGPLTEARRLEIRTKLAQELKVGFYEVGSDGIKYMGK